MIRFNKILILGLILCVFLGCKDYKQVDKKRELKNLSFADSTWIRFAQAMELKDYNYLMKNSLDTIRCTECDMKRGLGFQKENDFYDSQIVFKTRIDELMHLDSLTNREFSTFEGDDIIYVNYIVKSKKSMDFGYNLIFTFIKTNKGFKFNGMIIT